MLAEIFEFDAMNEPPSVLDMEVFDFDGPFDEATSLGRAEINFLKSNISDLSDIWIPLQGKLAQACQSKLHLRIFLNNTKGSNVVKDYLTKMEKEVGKKVMTYVETPSLSDNTFVIMHSHRMIWLKQHALFFADKGAFSSNKFDFPEAFWIASRGVSHQ